MAPHVALRVFGARAGRFGSRGSSREVVSDKYWLRCAACRGSAGLLPPAGMGASWGQAQKKSPRPLPGTATIEVCCPVPRWGFCVGVSS